MNEQELALNERCRQAMAILLDCVNGMEQDTLDEEFIKARDTVAALLDEPQAEEPKKEWLVWSVQHNAWWKHDGWGYTKKYSEAKRFTYKQACAICRTGGFRRSSALTHRDIRVPNETMILAQEETGI